MRSAWVVVLAIVPWFCGSGAAAQKAPRESPNAESLAELLSQADRGNPAIASARSAWQAARLKPSQASAMPDPQVVVQHFTVGSPRPFAGWTNSDFAYLGFGIEQDIPYPGKLKLRGELAESEADADRQRYESVRHQVFSEVKDQYYRLAFLGRDLEILERNRQLLEQVVQAAEARYRAGEGAQQDILQAQLQSTKLLGELQMRRLEADRGQAALKQLLGRAQTAADIATQPLALTPLPGSYDDLAARLESTNPAIAAARIETRHESLGVDLARKDFDPDFHVGYMWQHTSGDFRDYYMLTFGVTLPLHRRARLEPELAQARENLNRSQADYRSEVNQASRELRDEYSGAERAGELLKISSDGLIPQARAEFDAALAAYSAGRADFQALLSAFLDVFGEEENRAEYLYQHELAVGRIEELVPLDAVPAATHPGVHAGKEQEP